MEEGERQRRDIGRGTEGKRKIGRDRGEERQRAATEEQKGETDGERQRRDGGEKGED